MPSMCTASALFGSAAAARRVEFVGVGQKPVTALLLGEDEGLTGMMAMLGRARTGFAACAACAASDGGGFARRAARPRP